MLAEAFNEYKERTGRINLLVSIEGPDGVGKSTQADLLAATDYGIESEYRREPGGTPFGECMRDALMKHHDGLDPMARLHAFFAGRIQLLADINNRPGLFVYDRCYLSTYVFQHGIDGVPISVIDGFMHGLKRMDVIILLSGPTRANKGEMYDGVDTAALYARAVSPNSHVLRFEHLIRIDTTNKTVPEVQRSIVDHLRQWMAP